MNVMVEFCRRVTDHVVFEAVVAAVIMAVAVNIGVTLSWPEYREVGLAVDAVGSAFFCAELALRMVAYGRKWYRFFANGWNVFDFVIIVGSLLPFVGPGYMAARLLRIMKLGRLFASTPQMRILITAMLRSIVPSLGVCMLLLIVIYVYAVIGTELYAGNDPQRFGNLGSSLVTMFSFITVDDWYNAYLTAYHGSDVYCAYETAVELAKSTAPHAFGWRAGLFFFSYMIFVTFIVMNLFVGVIINCLQTAQEQIREKHHSHRRHGKPAPSSAKH